MKNLWIIIISILVFVVISTSVHAQSAQLGDSRDAKSIKDPLFIELHDTVHQDMPVRATIHINDESIKKNAKYIEINAGTANPYGLNGKKIYYDSSGNFRQTMPYNGEDKIEFGFRPTLYADSYSTTSATFYTIKESFDEEYPDTYDEKSPFYNMQCHRETNDLICDKEEGCIICHKVWGSVIRSYDVGWTKESISPPARFSFVDEKKKSETEFSKGKNPSYTNYLYSAEKKVTNEQGYETKQTESYSIKSSIVKNYDDIMKEKEWLSKSSMYKNSEINNIDAPGGLAEGTSFEIITYTPPKPSRNLELFNLNYIIYSELKPVGSGYLKIEANRKTVLYAGESSSEKEKVMSEAKAYAASLQLTKDKEGKSKTEHTHTYQVLNTGQEQETTDEHMVVGSVSDYFDHPLPYMKIKVQVKDKKDYDAITDKDGNFKVALEGIELEEGEEVDVRLIANFNYMRDGTNYFDIFKRTQRTTFTTYNIIQAAKDAKLTAGEHLQIDFKLNGEGDFITNLPNKEDIKHYSVIYYHTHEAVEFVLETLKETMDYKLPVTVYVGNPDKKTLYSPTESEILISSDDASLSDSDRPDNREYHEFMHALMYDIYNAWPQGRSQPGNINHDGFLNSNTADSYMEGFAEFMAMVISDEMKEPTPSIYAGFGSMDKNYKPWDGMGFDEEFAVASLLWDMYDDINEKGDSLTMSIEDIWKVLKVKRADFYEYYNAFKQEFPEKSNEIDELFKLHGFFHDTRIGDGNYTPGEPWKYINQQQGTYRFIDMSGNVSLITYEEDFTIGKAADYNRSNRTSAVRIPNAFLKVKDDEVDFYNIKVTSSEGTYDYVVDRKDDLIYIQPLPLGSDAVITVTPKSNDYTTTKPFTITAKELNDALNPENELYGYFAEHEFELKSTGTKTDEKYILYENTKPTYDYEGDLGEDYEVKKDLSEEFIKGGRGSSSGSSSWLWIILFILLGVFLYFYFSKPKFKNKTNFFLKKAFEWLKKNVWPTIKKFSIWLWKWIVKISKLIFYHSKKAYQKTKPYVKKAHKNIKKKINEQKNKKKDSEQKQRGK